MLYYLRTLVITIILMKSNYRNRSYIEGMW